MEVLKNIGIIIIVTSIALVLGFLSNKAPDRLGDEITAALVRVQQNGWNR